MAKVMIRSLPFHVRENTLRDLFDKYGSLTDCKLIMDRNDPGKSRGFAFITFSNKDDALKAISEMDNYTLEGRNIRVHLDDKSGGNSGNFQRQNSVGGGSYSSSNRDNYDRRSDRNDYGRDRNRDEDRSYARDRSPRRHKGSGAEDMQDPNNTNGRIYIEGLPEGTTEDEIAQHFGMLGQVAKKKQRQGYPKDWPYKVSIYVDESGKQKGDATLTYVDPNAAQSAPAFFNETEFKGVTIKVQMAEQKEPASRGGGSGGNRRDSSRRDDRDRRDDRRDNYRDNRRNDRRDYKRNDRR